MSKEQELPEVGSFNSEAGAPTREQKNARITALVRYEKGVWDQYNDTRVGHGAGTPLVRAL